jgi:hypothetical protein
MGARRLWFTGVASLCVFVCGGLLAVSPAVAATHFGSPGQRAGQFKGAYGVALDSATDDVYVEDSGNHRVDKFDHSGDFLLGWGVGVNATSPANELQTCTVATGCQEGILSSEPRGGTAVDNDPVSPSHGDVYMLSLAASRVEKFDSEGKFLLTFGGEVNETKDNTPGAIEAEKDVCVAGEKCRGGTEGAADGQFEFYYKPDGILAVGPAGRVYVGDQARVQVFEPSGAWRENISLTGLSATGRVSALAVNAAGDVFVKDEGVPGVHEFEPGGLEAPAKFDELSETIEAITLDEAGDVFVADFIAHEHVRILEYGSAGQELASFGSDTVGSLFKEGTPFPGDFATGMAFSSALDQLYVSSGQESDVWILASPSLGPLIEPGSEAAAPESHGTATLQASVNPEGNETIYHFEYVDEASFQASGWTSAINTPPTSAGSGFEDDAASVTLANLAPGVYHYRIVATNSQGTATGPDQTLTTALIEGLWASAVSDTSATIAASVDPLGTSTEYRIEYGTSTSYGHTASGNLGEGSTYLPVSTHQQGLEPATEYHYRIAISDEFGTFEGPDHTFTTQPPASAGLTLPDGRAWELVSPPDKKGALIEPPPTGALIQAASDGSGITYVTEGPAVGENPQTKTLLAPVLSTRIPGAWRTTDITLPLSLAGIGEKQTLENYGQDVKPEYRAFSHNLSLAVVDSQVFGTPLLSPEATEGTPYIRNDTTGTYTPLVTPADVAPETKFGGEGENGNPIRTLAATQDTHHVVLASNLALTPGANNGSGSGCNNWNLYEWGEGRLQLVSLLPDGKLGSEALLGGEQCAQGGLPEGSVSRAVSDDGRWVAWTSGSPFGYGRRYEGLYLRDTVGQETLRVGGSFARLQTMSKDGSRVFYVESDNLYDFEPLTRTTTNMTTAFGPTEHSGGVKELVMGTSEDGSYVYFVATSVLASGGVSGEDNLYLAHDGPGGWTTKYITTLGVEDTPDWLGIVSDATAGGTEFVSALTDTTSRVSPDGRYLTFMSNRSLTGYDNTDVASGQRDEEVYLYDAATGRLACASCNPTGARPQGVLDTFQNGENGLLLVDRMYEGAWNGKNGRENGYDPQWLAGSLPAWYGYGLSGIGVHQPRYLSDSGRLFFNSPDALVPQDSNGLEDVYEFEPVGVGGCSERTSSGSDVYVSSSGGCVGLISSGTSSSESAFFDASESGDDVFFITASKLVGADYDTGYDVYDAHVCGSEGVGCVSEPVSPPPCTSGDSCKAAPSPQPEIFGATPSATFSGQGNVVEAPRSAVRSRSLTKAQKLARALRACRGKRNGRKRAACERQARKRYAAKQSRNAKATKKGHR